MLYISQLISIRLTLSVLSWLSLSLCLFEEYDNELLDLSSFRSKSFQFVKSPLDTAVEDLDPFIFDYVIGLKLTSTNLIFHVTDAKGRVLIANTQNRIMADSSSAKKDSGSTTAELSLVLHAIKEDAKNKIHNEKDLIVLHLHNFQEKNVQHILGVLIESFNIKAVILTNSNPHNGCRPPKVKTSHALHFGLARKSKEDTLDIFRRNG